LAKKQKEFWETNALNRTSWQLYYNRLVELAISMFEWKNLPETVDPRYLELVLFSQGQAVFFKDEVLGYLGLQAIISGNFDVYRIPKNRRAYAVNGYQKQLTDKDSVLIFNNYLHTPSNVDIEVFARRLYNLDRSVDVNTNAQKTPMLITCNENERLTMKNLYEKYEGNEPVIFGTKDLKTSDIQAISTGVPFVADRLYQLKVNIWSEALTYLGISNVSNQKKERMLVSEVSGSLGSVISSRYSRLESRREACKKINDMFGLNIEVDYRKDYREQENAEVIDSTTENIDNKEKQIDEKEV